MQRLESLRVSADFNATDYVRGVQAKIAADNAADASSRGLGKAISETTTKISDSGGAIGRLSRMYIEGYGAASRFNKEIATLGKEIDKDAAVMGRAESILDGLYKKFGFAADATALFEKGQIGLATAVHNVNQRIGAQNESLERSARAAAAAAQAQKSQGFINNWAGVQTPSADASALRAADVQAYGKALDDVRAKFNPLYAANRQYYERIKEVNEAVATGAIKEKEAAGEKDRARNTYLAQSRAIREAEKATRDFGTSTGFASHQVGNLGYQLNDIVSGLAMGQSPMMILTQQGGQVYQILGQHPQGVGGAVKEIGSRLLGLATPARIAATGIVGVATAGLMAQNSFRKGQIEIELALTGIGRAAGVTAADINAVAAAQARLPRLSASEARQTATAVAASGQITAKYLGEALELSESLAKVLGVDVVEAGKTLGKVFADPVRGSEELNARLGAMDAATLRVVQNLAAQGKIQEANLVITRAVQASIQGAAEATTGWTRLWNVFSNTASNAWSGVGRIVDEALGGGDAEKRINFLQSRLSLLSNVNLFGIKSAEIQFIREEIGRIEAHLKRSAEQSIAVKQNLESIRIAQTLDTLLPDTQAKQALENRKTQLENAITGDPAIVAKAGRSIEELGQAYLKAERDVATFATSHQRAVNSLKIQIDAVNARSPAQLAEIARRQMTEQLRSSGLSPDEAAERIRLAGVVAYTQATRQLTEAQRDRVLTVKDAIAQSEIDISVLGKSVREIELRKLNFQTEADLRREAERNNTRVDEAQLNRLKKHNEELARRKMLLAEATLSSDLRFEREQIFRDPVEQEVAARLRSIYGDDLTSAQAQFYAGQIRVNAALKDASELGRSALKGFISDLRQGKTVGEAFGNVLNRIADKLVDIATDSAWAALMGRGGSGFLSFLFPGSSSGLGSSIGGMAGIDAWAGLRHSGLDAGPVSASGPGRFVNPIVFRNAEVRHNGLKPGERAMITMDGEEIGWPWQFQRKYGQNNSSAQGRSVIEVHIRTDPSEMFEQSIDTKSTDAAVRVVTANEKIRRKRYEAGGQFG